MGNFSMFNLFYICFKLCLELNAIIISPAISTEYIEKKKGLNFPLTFSIEFSLELAKAAR